jgi:hypothetical protein
MIGGISVALSADVGFTIYDFTRIVDGTRPSRSAAIAELAIATPQVLVLAWKGVFRSDDDADTVAKRASWILLTWTSLLAAHGAYYAFSSTDPDGGSAVEARPVMLTLGGAF